jgi:hypothetical protein
MSRNRVTLSVAFAASALLSLPAALAADYVPDYNVADGVDVETHTKIHVEADTEGLHYENDIGVHINYKAEVDADVVLDDTKGIEVDVDDPVDVLPVETIQVLEDKEFQLDGMDDINLVTLHLDGDVVQGDPDGVNESDGEQNVQENTDVVTPDPADSFLRQNLTNNSFNTDPADAANPVLRNTVDFSIASDGPITEDIAVNAAAGVFNLQANSMVVAIGVGLLGQSQADSRQDTVANGSVLQDATNEVFSTIDLEDVAANVGINLVSGVGNAQINSFTATTSFGP